jgi:signal transduction histidine kinase
MKNNIKTINDFILKENHKRFDSEKVSFLSHVSHGIRTPLNAIMGFSKLLVLKEVNENKKNEYIQGILNGGNLLLQFVDNIMDLSQFEAKNYSLRIKTHDINKIIWDFTEDFYCRKTENKDTDINLMIVWESKALDFDIETDAILLKKSIQRLINLVSVKYPLEEFEIGYRKLVNNSISIFVRPVLEKLSADILLDEKQLYSIDQDNSFDFFNYKVLSESISMLGGELNLDSDNQEYSFTIPSDYDNIERMNQI